VLKLLGGLITKLIFDELASPVLPFDHLHLTLVEALLLCLADHQVHILSLGFLLGTLVGTSLFVNSLLLFSSVGSRPAVIFCLSFPHVNTAGLVFFSVAVLSGFHRLFHPLGLVAHLLLRQCLGVTHPLINDLPGTLARFINFLDRLAFLSFEESDPVYQQTKVLFCLFPCLLCEDPFSVKYLIVVVLVGSQVDLSILLVIHITCLFIHQLRFGHHLLLTGGLVHHRVFLFRHLKHLSVVLILLKVA